MIHIEAVLEEDGTLISCKAEGHAGAGKTGSDIVCASVSVLMNTAYAVLSGREGITVSGMDETAPEKKPKTGFMRLEVKYKAEGKQFLFAVGMFLINGLSSVAAEYPNNCRITIKNACF